MDARDSALGGKENGGAARPLLLLLLGWVARLAPTRSGDSGELAAAGGARDI